MVDIQSVAAEIRRGKKKKNKIDRKKLQGKNIMAPLLHRVDIMNWTRTAGVLTCVSAVDW